MTVIPSGFAEMRWVISRTGDTDPYTTGIGLRSGAGGFSATDADDLAAAIKTTTLACLSTGETLTEFDFRYNDGAGVLPHTVPINQVGTLASIGQITSQNCAVLIQKHTARSGRRGKGRMYWPTVQDAEVDAVGAINPVVSTRLAAMLGALVAKVLATGGFAALVVLHSTVGDEPDDILAMDTSLLLATQRRRLRK